jgi:hypothetical protein
MDKNTTIKQARNSISKYLEPMKGKLRGLNLQCKEYLLQTYVGSLIYYVAPPLLAAKLIKEKLIENWER